MMHALNLVDITSRIIVRKTYGFEVLRAFKVGDPKGLEHISRWMSIRSAM
jgi:hypothetical protein